LGRVYRIVLLPCDSRPPTDPVRSSGHTTLADSTTGGDPVAANANVPLTFQAHLITESTPF